MAKIDGIVKMSSVGEVDMGELMEKYFSKYGWEGDEKYLRDRFAELSSDLKKSYSLEIVLELKALRFIDSYCINFRRN